MHAAAQCSARPLLAVSYHSMVPILGDPYVVPFWLGYYKETGQLHRSLQVVAFWHCFVSTLRGFKYEPSSYSHHFNETSISSSFFWRVDPYGTTADDVLPRHHSRLLNIYMCLYTYVHMYIHTYIVVKSIHPCTYVYIYVYMYTLVAFGHFVALDAEARLQMQVLAKLSAVAVRILEVTLPPKQVQRRGASETYLELIRSTHQRYRSTSYNACPSGVHRHARLTSLPESSPGRGRGDAIVVTDKYVHIYVYTHGCTSAMYPRPGIFCIYIYMYLYVHICVKVHICIYTYAVCYASVCVFAYVYVLSRYIYMHIYIYISYICTFTTTVQHTPAFWHLDLCVACIYLCVQYMHICLYMYMYTCACM